ncbi:MAG: molybdopterin-dependent oxidoreductase [Acetobacteraceae bacterium]|nr:molybdopterin-dependent oxidoreductase [Acetobacteraceae bacterium]
MKLPVYGDEMAMAALSMILGRPVKFAADRLEPFISPIHSRDHLVRARIGVSKAGEILAIEAHDLSGISAYSAYPRTSALEGNQVVRRIAGPCKHANYRADLAVVFQNRT